MDAVVATAQPCLRDYFGIPPPRTPARSCQESRTARRGLEPGNLACGNAWEAAASGGQTHSEQRKRQKNSE